MNILITNDDGIYSPGIVALAGIATQFGTVRVAAPDVEQSSMAHAITASRPLRFKKSPINFEHDIEAVRINGTPADCVALGLHLWKDTEVVLSGINLGLNVGNSMWHSGTLAGAKQAVLFGKKGIALSTPAGKTEPDFDSLKPYVNEALELLLADKTINLTNINFPHKPRGIRYTRQAVQNYDGVVIPGQDPLGRTHYWFSITPLEPADTDTDRWAVENNYTSITPLRLDLTNDQELIRFLNQ